MKSGAWGEVEERRLVGAVVAHEKKTRELEEGLVSRKKRMTGDQPSVWHKISDCVPQR